MTGRGVGSGALFGFLPWGERDAFIRSSVKLNAGAEYRTRALPRRDRKLLSSFSAATYRLGRRAEPEGSFFGAKHAAAPSSREGALTPDHRITSFIIFGAHIIVSSRLLSPNVKDEPREGLARLLALQEA